MTKWKTIFKLINQFRFVAAFKFWSFVGEEKLETDDEDFEVYYSDE